MLLDSVARIRGLNLWLDSVADRVTSQSKRASQSNRMPNRLHFSDGLKRAWAGPSQIFQEFRLWIDKSYPLQIFGNP